MKEIKIRIFLFASLLFSIVGKAQIGINTPSPKATLDITAKSTGGTTSEGMICPRLLGDQIQAGDAQYTAAQTGAIVYALNAVSTTTPKTINITSPGNYYFDGSRWQKFMSVSPTPTIFIPHVLAAGSTTATQTLGSNQTFIKSVFNHTINDGNWSAANNNYTATKAGFYQITFQSVAYPSQSPNSCAWVVRIISTTNGQSIALATALNALTGEENAVNRGGSITVNLGVNDVLDLGFATGAGNYTTNQKSFTITFLGS